MSDPRPALRPKFVLWTLALSAAVLSLGLLLAPRPDAPVVHWRFGPQLETAEPFAEVHRYDAMELEIELPEAAWVYVASFDFERGGVGYFPSEYLNAEYNAKGWQQAHHLPAGTHRLPGPDSDGEAQSWYVPRVEQAMALCVVVSKTRLGALDQAMSRMRQFGNTAFPGGGFGYYIPRVGKDEMEARTSFAHPMLEEARHGAQPSPLAWRSKERPEVFLHCFHVRARPARKGVENPDPMRKHVKDLMKNKVPAKIPGLARPKPGK